MQELIDNDAVTIVGERSTQNGLAGLHRDIGGVVLDLHQRLLSLPSELVSAPRDRDSASARAAARIS